MFPPFSGVLLRPVALSLVYLIFVFVIPFIPVATAKSLKERTGFFLKILIAFSVLLCSIQIAFQIVLAALENNFLPSCRFLEILFRHIGLVRLDDLDPLTIARYLVPEILMFVGSILIFVLLKRNCRENLPLHEINVEPPTQDGEPTTTSHQEPPYIDGDHGDSMSPDKWKLVLNIGKVLSLILLAVSGTIQPSVPSFIYFAIFMGFATMWGCNKELELYVIRFREELCFLLVFSFQSLCHLSKNMCSALNRSYHMLFGIPESLAPGIGALET